MMKIPLFLLVLIAGALADSDNNNCAFNLGSPGGACLITNDCASGLSCVSGTCRFVTLGQTCSADSQCGGLYPFCISGRCDAKRIPGDPCTSAGQCISGSCNATCLSRTLNEACGGSDCAPGTFCNPLTRVCSAKLAVGASCANLYSAMVSNIAFAHDLTVMCSDSALCDYNSNSGSGQASGFCTPIFSATQSCGAFGSFTCPVGSTCNGGSCQSISGNNNNNNNTCGGSLQCGGISTFCGCSGNNNNFQVYSLPTSQTSVTVPAAGASNQGVSVSTANVGTQGATVSVIRQAVVANTQGVAVNTGQTGAAVGTQGAAVGTGQTGAAVGTQGAAVGTGQTGAAVGTQGAVVQTGQTGAVVGTQGAAVGTGQTGAAVGTQGAVVQTGQTGAVVGTQGAVVQTGTGTAVIINTNNNGQCITDQCLSSFAPDYYSCMLQNGCGLATEPVFIDGTCASNCAFLYSRIKCCQAGSQPIVSQNGATNNNGNNNNSLQRSIVLPPQVRCVSFTQTQAPSPSSAGSLGAGILVAASLMVAFIF